MITASEAFLRDIERVFNNRHFKLYRALSISTYSTVTASCLLRSSLNRLLHVIRNDDWLLWLIHSKVSLRELRWLWVIITTGNNRHCEQLF